MLNLNSILIFSEDPVALAEFYSQVFDKDPDWEDGEYYGFVTDAAVLNIGPHEEVSGSNPNPERIMINFETEDVEGEFLRIQKLGAAVVAEPYQMEGYEGWIATLEDPDGNYFQLMTPWEGE